MKKLVLIFSLAIGTVVLMSFKDNLKVENVKNVKNFESDYDRGWAAGWCEGWKDVKGQYAYCPSTPYPPYPKYDCNEGYKCGYNRGFKYGMCKAKERDCEK
jgi:hypothetical protein